MFKISILICTFYTLMSKLYTSMYKINTLIHARIKGEGGPEPFSSKFKFLNYLNYSWHCMFQRFICLKLLKITKKCLRLPPPFQYSNNARTPPGNIFLFRASYLYTICKIYLWCMTGKERVSTWDRFRKLHVLFHILHKTKTLCNRFFL